MQPGLNLRIRVTGALPKHGFLYPILDMGHFRKVILSQPRNRVGQERGCNRNAEIQLFQFAELFSITCLQLRELLTNALDTINCECWSRGYPLSKLFRLYSEVCCYYLLGIRFPCQSRIMELYF